MLASLSWPSKTFHLHRAGTSVRACRSSLFDTSFSCPATHPRTCLPAWRPASFPTRRTTQCLITIKSPSMGALVLSRPFTGRLVSSRDRARKLYSSVARACDGHLQPVEHPRAACRLPEHFIGPKNSFVWFVEKAVVRRHPFPLSFHPSSSELMPKQRQRASERAGEIILN